MNFLPDSPDTGTSLAAIALSIFFFLLFLNTYFLPSIIAKNGEKCDRAAIFVLNLFLGWTLVGWVLALAWAVTTDRKEHIITLR